MQIITLAASAPLSKTYYRTQAGNIKADNYPHVSAFTSTAHDITTPQALLRVVKQAAQDQHCLLKGTIDRPLVNESRAGATKPNAPTSWICLDVDGLPSIKTAEDFMALLPAPFQSTSYVVQYSASHGVKDDLLHCHIFMLLAQPAEPALLKFWLRQLNFDLFADQLTLRKNHNALNWLVDDTTCQNDKLLYVTPPRLSAGVTDNFKGQRIALCKKTHAVLTFDFTVDYLQLKQREFTKINELRRQLGEAAFRKDSLRLVDGIEIQHHASPVLTWETKEARDFTYFNLNGGNSWGYFHPKDRPDIIYNFKGEPNYLTSELLPDYWAPIQAERDALKAARLAERDELLRKKTELEEQKRQERELKQLRDQEKAKARLTQATENPADENGYRYFACIDNNSKRYYYGKYNEDTQDFVLHDTDRRILITDFYNSHGQDIPAFFPYWDVSFRFEDDERINFEEGRINLYNPSPLMQRDPRLPPNITHTYLYDLLMHAVGSDQESYDHFVNWLAYIYQYRTKPGIAWVLHGVEGTGKGLFFDKVIRPIFGEQYCFETTIDTIADDKFNLFLERNIFCLINESDTDNAHNRSRLSARMKTYITDPKLSIRRMRQDPYMVRNYSNFIVFSNKAAPALIDINDRRWSVAKGQNTPLPKPTKQHLEQLEAEVSIFADYLKTYPVNVSKAITPLINEDRSGMQELSLNTNEWVAHMIRTGNFAYLIEHRPEVFRPTDDDSTAARRLMPTYDEVLDFIIENPTRITRDGMEILFHYLADRQIGTPTIFSRYLSHLKFRIKTIRIGDRLFQGLTDIPWQITPELIAELRAKQRRPNELPASVQPSQSQAQKPKRSSRLANRSSSGLRVVK